MAARRMSYLLFVGVPALAVLQAAAHWRGFVSLASFGVGAVVAVVFFAGFKAARRSGDVPRQRQLNSVNVALSLVAVALTVALAGVPRTSAVALAQTCADGYVSGLFLRLLPEIKRPVSTGE